MIAALALVAVAVMFVTAARVATIALVGTGMSSESASFQARSALMGVGFTTSGAEAVINHPVRRRVILWLMTFGNAGVITGIASLLLGFVNADADQVVRRTAILVAGMVLVIVLTRSAVLERVLSRLTRWALARWTSLDTRDFAQLLRFGSDHGIIELATHADDWLVGRPLSRLDLPEEGVAILGIQRLDGDFIGAPTGRTTVHAGDVVIAYGRVEHLQELDDRHRGRRGDYAHREAVQEHQELIAEPGEDRAG